MAEFIHSFQVKLEYGNVGFNFAKLKCREKKVSQKFGAAQKLSDGILKIKLHSVATFVKRYLELFFLILLFSFSFLLVQVQFMLILLFSSDIIIPVNKLPFDMKTQTKSLYSL